MRIAAVLIVTLAACAGGSEAPTSVAAESSTTGNITATSTTEESMPGGCANVVDVEIAQDGDGSFTFHVTIASADEGWEKYADQWIVRDPAGAVLGTRTLTHPHVDEQPFTRSLAGVHVPADVSVVEVAARDSIEGFCGETLSTDVR